MGSRPPLNDDGDSAAVEAGRRMLRKNSTSGTRLYTLAISSGLNALKLRAFALAFASTSTLALPMEPLAAAWCKGVQPSRSVCAAKLALAPTNDSTTETWSWSHAS